jgi:hypothetical protein
MIDPVHELKQAAGCELFGPLVYFAGKIMEDGIGVFPERRSYYFQGIWFRQIIIPQNPHPFASCMLEGPENVRIPPDIYRILNELDAGKTREDASRVPSIRPVIQNRDQVCASQLRDHSLQCAEECIGAIKCWDDDVDAALRCDSCIV